mmetsp:Transcript_18688/g.31808  ORF Transcript_18688/g.31808 Transcript_18688/m.31808 type:complete len:221 (-) Transcript_18688:638-1300(-)
MLSGVGAPPDELHESAIGYNVMSLTEKSRTLKAGESIAACRAQPLAMHSSKFSVLEHSRPKKAEMRCCTAGMRTDPPTISTVLISSFVRPDASKACAISLSSLSRAGAADSRKSARSTILLTSMSFMKHSMLMGACGLAERTFFVFSHATSSRYMAFLFVSASMPCFSFHSAAKRRPSSMSKSRPPSLRSHAVARTVSLPLMKPTMVTVVSIAPMSTKAT